MKTTKTRIRRGRTLPSKAITLSLLLACTLAWPSIPALAEDGNGTWQYDYSDARMTLTSPRGGWVFEPQIRLQTRYGMPYSDDPRTLAALQDTGGGELELRRSRFKLDVQLGIPSLTLYSETELQGMDQLDLRVTWQPSKAFGLRAGQWKPEYNRERRDSSGAQQFVERSIVNREFTIDRQQGVMVFGRVGAGTALDFNGWLGLFGGAGRDSFNDGGQMMPMARLQWNPNGVVLPFDQGDLERREEPTGSIAVATVRNRSRYTRFSSDGGGQLSGYAIGQVDQYELRQWMLETAFHWRGFSWQQEWHHKTVQDHVLGGERRLEGLYAQAGYFPHERWPAFPRPLELALRYAQVDPDTSGSDASREASLAANWYFRGHRNKLNFDVSRLSLTQGGESDHGWRARVQWDVSF